MFYADLCFPETIAMIEEQFYESVTLLGDHHHFGLGESVTLFFVSEKIV
jgi:hypothetical protein